jgi:tripartite-type tricarboxylate transporter receptor subunit TctC
VSLVSKILHGVVAAAAIASASGGALAQTSYPDKPVRIIVPFPPGGPSDVLARAISQGLTAKWGVPVTVDNKAGGLTVTAAMEAKRAPPDGSVILVATDATYAINPFIFNDLPYKPMEDYEHVTLIASQSTVFMANKTLPATDLRGLIDYAKKNPGKLNYGAGITSLQLAGAMFDKMAGVKTTFVPYKGGAELAKAMLGGEIHFAIDGIPANVPLIKAGTLTALATTGLQRTPALPDVPTLHELGVTGFEVRPWNGLSVPKGTPRAVVDKIQRDTREVLQNPAVRAQLLALGQEVIGTTPEEFVETIRRDTAKYGPVVKELGLKVQ